MVLAIYRIFATDTAIKGPKHTRDSRVPWNLIPQCGLSSLLS